MSEFMSQSMTREAALRIGLAARELDIFSVTELVMALAARPMRSAASRVID